MLYIYFFVIDNLNNLILINYTNKIDIFNANVKIKTVLKEPFVNSMYICHCNEEPVFISTYLTFKLVSLVYKISKQFVKSHLEFPVVELPSG